MTLAQLRHKAGHTQDVASRYLLVSERTIKRIEKRQADGVVFQRDQALTEMYRLKLEKEEVL